MPVAYEMLEARIARLIHLDVTNKEWQTYPTATQQKVQYKYIRLAKKILSIVESELAKRETPRAHSSDPDASE